MSTALQRLAERVDRLNIGLHHSPPEVIAILQGSTYTAHLDPGDSLEDAAAFLLDLLEGRMPWPEGWGEAAPELMPIPYAFPEESSDTAAPPPPEPQTF